MRKLNLRVSLLVLVVMMLLLISAGIAGAQGERDPFRVEVQVEDAFVRLTPSLEGEWIASVFEDDVLVVVGRNLDGTWFEVRRLGRINKLGWVFNEMLEWDFDVGALPLTDFQTGTIGPEPLAAPVQTSIFILENAVLRDAPFTGGRITIVPHSTTVPLLYRNQDASAFLINYLGYQGWVSSLAVRIPPNPEALSVAPGLPPLDVVPAEIVPPEIQRAQLERLRAFINANRIVAVNMENFWWLVSQGRIVPCEPPGFVAAYLYGDRDVRQLPELDRHAPRVNEAIDYLNASITPLQNCGIIGPREVQRARSAAINARIIFDATLNRLEDVEETIR